MKDIRVIFDAERMKYPHTGLYHFCKDLGQSVLKDCPNDREIYFYLNSKVDRVFGTDANYLNQRSIDKFLKPRYNNFDIWHSTFQLSDYLPINRNIKVVATIHDLNFLKEKRTEQKREKYLNKIQKLIERSSAIVAISNYVKEDLLEHCNLLGKPLEVIYNGCHVNVLEKVHQPSNNETFVDGQFIYSLGTINRKKNVHILPYLLIGNDLKLVMSGIIHEQDYFQRIQDIVQELGLEDRFIYTGPVTESEKFYYLKNCSLFAFPSIAEGFGLPVIEAMSFGKKVLLSNHTALPEIGGSEAFYLEETSEDYMRFFGKEKLLGILNATPREREIKEWASQFSWDKASKQYWNIYKTLL